MGLEVITQPQLFTKPITALGGYYGINEAYPLLTTYQSWTSTASVNASAFPIPGTWTMLDEPGSFIVTVGGVYQPSSEYTVNRNTRILTFNSIVSAGVEIAAQQLATASPSSQSFNFIKSVSATFTSLSAVVGTFNSLSATTGTINNLLVTNLTAISSTLNIVDITQYELSGFNILGNANITGNTNVTGTVSALNYIISDNGTLVGNTSGTSIGIGSLSARTFALVHEPALDGVDPVFDIGETVTGSFSGFRIRYDELTNRLLGLSRTDTTVLTSFVIDTTTGQVGISGLPTSGQALTVNGNLSTTNIAVGSNINFTSTIVSIGSAASTTLNNTTSGNVYIGTGVARNQGATLGNKNVYIGENVATNYTNSRFNVFLGSDIATANTANGPTFSVAVGQAAGQALTNGAANTFVGKSAGATVATGNRNIVVGADSTPAAAISHAIVIGTNITASVGNLLYLGSPTTAQALSTVPGTTISSYVSGLVVNLNGTLFRIPLVPF